MSENKHKCYVCGNEVIFTQEENEHLTKCSSCETLLKKIPDSEHAIPVGMELPESFQKAELEKIARLTSPENEAKAKRFRKRAESDTTALDEISLRLSQSIRDLVTETVRMELNGESSSYKKDPQSPQKKESRGLKQSGKKFEANRKITPSEGLYEEEDKSGKMMTPEERNDFIKAHQEAGAKAKEIASHNQKDKRFSLPFFVTIILGLIAFFMLIAYVAMLFSGQLVKDRKEAVNDAPVEETSVTANKEEAKEKEAEVVNEQEAPTFDSIKAKTVALEFINARDHKYATQLIIPFLKMESVVPLYWSSFGSFQTDDLKEGPLSNSPSGTPYMTFYASKEDKKREVIVILNSEGQYQVDWKSFQGVEEGSLKEFLESGGQSKMTLRTKLTVADQYTAFYNKLDWLALTAKDPDGNTALFYLPKRTGAYEKLVEGMVSPISVIESEKSGRYIYTVLSGAGSRPVIIDVIKSHWVD